MTRCLCHRPASRKYLIWILCAIPVLVIMGFTFLMEWKDPSQEMTEEVERTLPFPTLSRVSEEDSSQRDSLLAPSPLLPLPPPAKTSELAQPSPKRDIKQVFHERHNSPDYALISDALRHDYSVIPAAATDLDITAFIHQLVPAAMEWRSKTAEIWMYAHLIPQDIFLSDDNPFDIIDRVVDAEAARIAAQIWPTKE